MCLVTNVYFPTQELFPMSWKALYDPRRLPDRTAPVCLLPLSSDPAMDGYCEYFGVWELGLFSAKGPIFNHYYNTFFLSCHLSFAFYFLVKKKYSCFLFFTKVLV